MVDQFVDFSVHLLKVVLNIFKLEKIKLIHDQGNRTTNRATNPVGLHVQS